MGSVGTVAPLRVDGRPWPECDAATLGHGLEQGDAQEALRIPVGDDGGCLRASEGSEAKGPCQRWSWQAGSGAGGQEGVKEKCNQAKAKSLGRAGRPCECGLWVENALETRGVVVAPGR